MAGRVRPRVVLRVSHADRCRSEQLLHRRRTLCRHPRRVRKPTHGPRRDSPLTRTRGRRSRDAVHARPRPRPAGRLLPQRDGIRARRAPAFDYTPSGDDTAALSTTAADALGVYHALPTLSKTSLIDLWLSTRALPWALEPGDPAVITVASVTTVRSAFRFAFDLHLACDVRLKHHDGQVKINAVVPAHRGDDRLFVVIEASGTARVRLRKQYYCSPRSRPAAGRQPASTASSRCLRARRDDDGDHHYRVYECAPVPTGESACLVGVTVERVRAVGWSCSSGAFDASADSICPDLKVFS